MYTKIIVEDWTFSTSEKCHEHGDAPYDGNWEITKVNGNWIGVNCLREMANRYQSKYQRKPA